MSITVILHNEMEFDTCIVFLFEQKTLNNLSLHSFYDDFRNPMIFVEINEDVLNFFQILKE